MTFTREKKIDLASAVLGVAGIGAAVAASELAIPALMIGGVVLVLGTGIYRVADLRHRKHIEENHAHQEQRTERLTSAGR
jgi:arginine exporter protein ArgO